MPIADRVSKAIDRIGENFTLDGSTYKGVFRLLDMGTMRTYLDDVEVLGVAKPAFYLTTKSDVPIQSGSTITRGTQSYQVLKHIKLTIGAETVAKCAVLSV